MYNGKERSLEIVADSKVILFNSIGLFLRSWSVNGFPLVVLLEGSV